MNRSEQINELATALAKAQGEFVPTPRTNRNLFFKSSYADLAGVHRSSRPSLSKHGLSVVQTLTPKDHAGGYKVTLSTLLLHNSGQWISSEMDICPQKADAQGIGSFLTYMRRYAEMAIIGQSAEEEDDDGNGGVHNNRVNNVTAPKEKPLNAAPKPLNAAPKELCTAAQRYKLFAMSAELGYGREHLEDLLYSHFGDEITEKTEVGTTRVSTALLTKGQIQIMFKELEMALPKKESKPPNSVADVVDKMER
jgi:ERF superfamily